MRKFTKTLAVVLSLSMTLTMGAPVFAEGTADSSNTVTTVVEAPVVTPTPAQENKPPKTGFYKKAGKTYYYKNGKLVKNKYGYKIKNKYYHIPLRLFDLGYLLHIFLLPLRLPTP